MEEHPANGLPATRSTFSVREILTSDEQPKNALSPTERRTGEVSKEIIEEHPSKQL